MCNLRKSALRLRVKSYFCYEQKEQMLKHLCYARRRFGREINSICKDACSISIFTKISFLFLFFLNFSSSVIVLIGFQDSEQAARKIDRSGRPLLGYLVTF